MNGEKRKYGLITVYLRLPFLLGGIVLIGTICAGLFSFQAGIIMAVFTAVYMAVAVWFYTTRKTVLLKALIQFSGRCHAMQNQLLEEMSTPYALCDTSGNILWTNNAFDEVALFKEVQMGIMTLDQIFPNVVKDKFPQDNEAVLVHSELAGKRYNLELVRIELEAGSIPDDIRTALDGDTTLIAVYISDETEIVNLKQHLDDDRIVFGLVYIDNYDEVLENVEEVKRSLLIALIDRKINRYVSAAAGVIKKLEKDKYMFVIKHQYLKKLLDDRFSILEEVKTVNIGNELSVTLSIGIGYDGDSYISNYEYARTAIDMALGRGGDQAVVKAKDKSTFFGGKTQQMEKSTRVKARVKAHAFQEILESKDKVLIMGHKMVDVDSFGACVGVFRMATALGKKAYIVQNEITAPVIPLKERFLNNNNYPADMFKTGDQARDLVDAATAVVVVDVNRPSITDAPDLLKLCKTIIVFDHHRQCEEVIQGALLSYVETYASSACEMVAEMMQYINDGVRLRSPEADAMYAGIVIDSQEFVNQTGVRTFEAAAYLKRCGADITRIRKIFRENLDDYKAKAAAISNAEIYREGFAISVCNAKGLASPTVTTAQAANGLLEISGIKASVVFCSYAGKIYVSARSIDEVNVQVLMEKMGGGGHKNVAGAQLTEGSIEEAIATVKACIDEMIKEGEVS